jgi:hypothetical protein
MRGPVGPNQAQYLYIYRRGHRPTSSSNPVNKNGGGGIFNGVMAVWPKWDISPNTGDNVTAGPSGVPYLPVSILYLYIMQSLFPSGPARASMYTVAIVPIPVRYDILKRPFAYVKYHSAFMHL